MLRRALILTLLGAGLSACGGDPSRGEPRSAPAPRLSDTLAGAPAPRPRGRHLMAQVIERTWLRSAPDGRRLHPLGTVTEFGSRHVLPVLARRDGWLKVLSPKLDNGRHGWIPESRAALDGTFFSIHIDRSARRLVVRHRDRTLRRLPVAIGRPGNETPLGRFAVTDKLKPEDPTSPYGCCALALTGHQPKLVPGWPGGDRLAIHGSPVPGSIGSAVSLGCLRAPERDLRVMLRQIPLGTPVFIRA